MLHAIATHAQRYACHARTHEENRNTARVSGSIKILYITMKAIKYFT